MNVVQATNSAPLARFRPASAASVTPQQQFWQRAGPMVVSPVAVAADPRKSGPASQSPPRSQFVNVYQKFVGDDGGNIQRPATIVCLGSRSSLLSSPIIRGPPGNSVSYRLATTLGSPAGGANGANRPRAPASMVTVQGKLPSGCSLSAEDIAEMTRAAVLSHSTVSVTEPDLGNYNRCQASTTPQQSYTSDRGGRIQMQAVAQRLEFRNPSGSRPAFDADSVAANIHGILHGVTMAQGAQSASSHSVMSSLSQCTALRGSAAVYEPCISSVPSNSYAALMNLRSAGSNESSGQQGGTVIRVVTQSSEQQHPASTLLSTVMIPHTSVPSTQGFGARIVDNKSMQVAQNIGGQNFNQQQSSESTSQRLLDMAQDRDVNQTRSIANENEHAVLQSLQISQNMGQNQHWFDETRQNVDQNQPRFTDVHPNIDQPRITESHDIIGQNQPEFTETQQDLCQSQIQFTETYQSMGQSQLRLTEDHQSIGQNQLQLTVTHQNMSQNQLRFTEAHQNMSQNVLKFAETPQNMGQNQPRFTESHQNMGQIQPSVTQSQQEVHRRQQGGNRSPKGTIQSQHVPSQPSKFEMDHHGMTMIHQGSNQPDETQKGQLQNKQGMNFINRGQLETQRIMAPVQQGQLQSQCGIQAQLGQLQSQRNVTPAQRVQLQNQAAVTPQKVRLLGQQGMRPSQPMQIQRDSTQSHLVSALPHQQTHSQNQRSPMQTPQNQIHQRGPSQPQQQPQGVVPRAQFIQQNRAMVAAHHQNFSPKPEYMEYAGTSIGRPRNSLPRPRLTTPDHNMTEAHQQKYFEQPSMVTGVQKSYRRRLQSTRGRRQTQGSAGVPGSADIVRSSSLPGVSQTPATTLVRAVGPSAASASSPRSASIASSSSGSAVVGVGLPMPTDIDEDLGKCLEEINDVGLVMAFFKKLNSYKWPDPPPSSTTPADQSSKVCLNTFMHYNN